MWQAIIVSVVLSLASVALMPRPKDTTPKRDFLKIPTAAAGDPLPVYFGTVWEKNPKVAYYGNPISVAIKKKGGKK